MSDILGFQPKKKIELIGDQCLIRRTDSTKKPNVETIKLITSIFDSYYYREPHAL